MYCGIPGLVQHKQQETLVLQDTCVSGCFFPKVQYFPLSLQSFSYNTMDFLADIFLLSVHTKIVK